MTLVKIHNPSEKMWANGRKTGFSIDEKFPAYYDVG
jgi:hypothetical protein